VCFAQHAPHFFALENSHGCNASFTTSASLNHALERFKRVVPIRPTTRDDERVLNIGAFLMLKEWTACA
jgi:hypothetical protein